MRLEFGKTVGPDLNMATAFALAKRTLRYSASNRHPGKHVISEAFTSIALAAWVPLAMAAWQTFGKKVNLQKCF